ncbi:hypothetical protein, partial [Streptomyces sp. NRRL B-24085]|uniref:hypothetical protein n=1 Tax=Streptomyces sp. NRRL B-24085 TaxID=1709476 RepID=UPI001C501B87
SARPSGPNNPHHQVLHPAPDSAAVLALTGTLTAQDTVSQPTAVSAEDRSGMDRPPRGHGLREIGDSDRDGHDHRSPTAVRHPRQTN